ncbi:MAG TPA: hypothetical protein IGS53_01705 [Leptolyngbyaceae cyanobacterium M33_DOE_097]|nr:hypothetical protein [Leptolyngbyaceae cyanobacterium M33_DOE_097]
MTIFLGCEQTSEKCNETATDKGTASPAQPSTMTCSGAEAKKRRDAGKGYVSPWADS